MSRLNKYRYNVIQLTDYIDKIKLSFAALFDLGYKALIILFFTLSSLLFTSVQAASNTGLTGDDRYAGRFPIGFNFQFYDKTYDKFYVSTNGLIQFSTPTTSYKNQCLPADFNNTLYVFWDDLRTDVEGQPSGKIEYETLGQAPNRKLVVQWTNQYFFGSNMPMGTFQAILYEGTNQIKYQYRNLLDERSQGSHATVGIQNTPLQFAQALCNQTGAITSGQAITFTPIEDGNSYIIDTNADYDFVDISVITMDYPLPIARYTNQAPGWEWNKITGLNAYQIEIQNIDGVSLHQETLGNVDSYTYDAGREHGKTYRAKIRGSSDSGQNWENWSGLSSVITVDRVSPKAMLNTFERTSADSAIVTYQAADDLSGLRSVQLQVASDSDFKQIVADTTLPVNQSSYKLNQLPSSNTLFARISALDYAGNLSDYSDAIELQLAAPVIITPVNGTVVNEPFVTVSGTSYPNSQVRIYLDDVALVNQVQTDESGNFTSVIPLSDEQRYRLSVQAQTALGASPLSYEVAFSYQEVPATVEFITPPEGAVISAPTEITIIAADRSGIDKVDIYLDSTLLASLSEAPYSLMWQPDETDNGLRTLKATVTTGNGKTYEALNLIEVDMAPEPLPPTPYTGLLSSVTPTISYGQPIIIAGQAIDRTTSEAMANVPLRLVLINNGFKRTIAISSDDTGHFNYAFIPQKNDAGIYSVAVVHPQETSTPSQGEFTINHISFDITGYKLKAARNVEAKITVNARANLGTQGLRWIMRAEDQPNGQLPQGITIRSGQGIDIPANASAPTDINFTADDRANEAGNVFVVAVANDSGDIVRGKVQIQYQLTQAQPALYTTPTVIETGVAQEGSITETLTLANRGLTAAENVQVKLLDIHGATPPSWIFLASESTLGKINLEDTITLNITAQPDSSVTDGIYYYRLHISADNQSERTVPVAVSVVQNGMGGIRFNVSDIYTATLDENGQPILGVKDVTIKLQNDAVLTEQYTLKTDINGTALAEELPPGIYRYRASATKHFDISGRIRILPGVINNENIFLDYEIINIEFNVTETTVEDVYDINLDVTYNTQVPAPVVLFEPLAINLNGLQQGEEKTGQITLTNYGLVRADNLKFKLPQSDDRFEYEFFGELPTELDAKTRIVIPYKVTAKQQKPASREWGQNSSSSSLFAPFSDSAANDDGSSSKSQQCSFYSSDYRADYGYMCASQQESKGSNGGKYYDLNGPDCDEKWKENSNKDEDGNSSSKPLPKPNAMTRGCQDDAKQCGTNKGPGKQE